MKEEDVKLFCKKNSLPFIKREEFKTEWAWINYVRCLLTIKKELEELIVITGENKFVLKQKKKKGDEYA